MSGLRGLYDALAQGKADDWLRTNVDQVTAVNAHNAQEEAHECMLRSDAPGATTGFLAAAILFQRCGLAKDSIRARLSGASVYYLAATTREQYDRARDLVVQVAEAAASAGFWAIEAEARITAADCSWWGRDASSGEQRNELGRQVLQDVVAAWDAVTIETIDVQVERLATLTTVVLLAWSDSHDVSWDRGIRSSCQRLVVETDWWLKHNAAFTNEAGAMSRSQVASTLASSAKKLDLPVSETLVRRLQAAMHFAADEQNERAWVIACRDLVRHGRPVLGADAVGVLRADLRAAQGARGHARSRIGRLVNSARGDDLVGEELGTLVQDETPDPTEVFELAEVASARTLLDGIAGFSSQPDDDRCRELERAITSFPKPHPEDHFDEMRLVSELPIGSTVSLDALEQRYAELGAGFTASAPSLRLSEVQRLLLPDEVMVRYVLPRSATHPAFMPTAIVVTSRAMKFVRLPVPYYDSNGIIGRVTVNAGVPFDLSPLSNAVQKARAALVGTTLAEKADAQAHLARLDEMLLAPIRATGLTVGCTHWIVVPQRSLHLVPWMAMCDDSGRWLLDDAAVTIAPSASVWARLRSRPSHPAENLCVVGDPLVGYAGLSQLPGALAEAEHVADAWEHRGLRSVRLPREEATFPALAEAAPGCDVLHVAAHGSFPDETALFNHSLLLSPDIGHPGPVTADDVRGLDLSATQCVVLSVCDSGTYRVGPGDEPYGLVPAFLEAGARSVVAAQWPVDDDRARELMSLTGAALPSMGPAAALQKAVLELRNGTSDTSWTHAAFLVVGGAPHR